MRKAIDQRAPAPGTGDAAVSPRFYLSGVGTVGRPHVLVHKGDRTQAQVGAGVRIDGDVELVLGGNHRTEWVTSFALREVYELPGAFEGNPWSRGDIVVGDGAVLGRGARVLSGIRVGAGAHVLPYSIVTRDVDPFSVVGGSPARPIGVSPAKRLSWALRARVRHHGASWLRSAAARIEQPRWAPFPSPSTPSYANASITMGTGSHYTPRVHALGGPVEVVIGNYASVSDTCECAFGVAWPHADGSPTTLGDRGDLGAGGGRSIRIGSDTWIGRDARVVGAVTVGDGAVVAAYSVVTADVRPYAIVAGNPAREVGRRFDDDVVEALLGIRWWEWPDHTVQQRWADLCSADVGHFVERYGARACRDQQPGPGAHPSGPAR